MATVAAGSLVSIFLLGVTLQNYFVTTQRLRGPGEADAPTASGMAQDQAWLIRALHLLPQRPVTGSRIDSNSCQANEGQPQNCCWNYWESAALSLELLDTAWRKAEDDTNTKGSRAKRWTDIDFWWQFEFDCLDPAVPEATSWKVHVKEWIGSEWRFSRPLSWAQDVSIVLNRHSLYSWFKELISKQIISKAILITELYRNKWRVHLNF